MDWDAIAIVVHRSEMSSIPERINATDIASMRANVGCAAVHLRMLVLQHLK